MTTCKGCDRETSCAPLWPEGRKCCPDCTCPPLLGESFAEPTAAALEAALADIEAHRSVPEQIVRAFASYDEPTVAGICTLCGGDHVHDPMCPWRRAKEWAAASDVEEEV